MILTPTFGLAMPGNVVSVCIKCICTMCTLCTNSTLYMLFQMHSLGVGHCISRPSTHSLSFSPLVFLYNSWNIFTGLQSCVLLVENNLEFKVFSVPKSFKSYVTCLLLSEDMVYQDCLQTGLSFFLSSCFKTDRFSRKPLRWLLINGSGE